VATPELKFDYRIEVDTPPPPGYPSKPSPDSFNTTPFEVDYTRRREAYLQHVLANPAPENTKAVFCELVRLSAGGYPHHGILHAALDYIQARKDCADFVLHGVLRMLFQFGDHPDLAEDLLQRARRVVLDFKYWPDEPGIDSLCTWTENHQILFASGAYLAGQLYPDQIFTNSKQTGEQKMALNRLRILRWLDLRFRSGFSEWLSHVYYDEDLTALLNLLDFSHDREIAVRSEMVIDTLLLDMAFNSFQGVFGSTHGRSYAWTKKWARKEGTTDTSKLLFGSGVFSNFDNMSAAAFVLSPSFRLSEPIVRIANDMERPAMINRQRMGIAVEEAQRWGLGFDNYEDGMVWLSLEAYAHPQTANLVMGMFDAYNWWQNDFFSPFARYKTALKFLRRTQLLKPLAQWLEYDLCRNTREVVDIYTYRTPDYMLSCAQDYRKGYGGDQQHIWQATLGPDAVCFTTHPAHLSSGSPSHWTGSALLPRAAQVENVVIALYKLESRPALYVPTRLFYTHAWLPRDRFDEVVERDGWIFARLRDGYLALRSMLPYSWQTQPGEDQGREVIAEGAQNAWICEMGRRDVQGGFDDFIAQITPANVRFEGLSLVYESPSQGTLAFDWDGPLLREGRTISLRDYPRYDNPYANAAYPAESIEISHASSTMSLDWSAGQVEDRLISR
jgi:hypothetical protein